MVIGRSEEEGGHLYVRERTPVVVVELELPAVHCDVNINMSAVLT